MESSRFENVDFDSDIQLEIEDSSDAAEYERVIFVDASVECAEPFTYTELAPKDSVSVSTHSVGPDGIIHLAKTVYGAEVTGYLLAIRGYEFEFFCETVSEKAMANLAKAEEFLKSELERR